MGDVTMSDTSVAVMDTERTFSKPRELTIAERTSSSPFTPLPTPYTVPPAPSKTQSIARLLTELTYGEMMEVGNAVSALTQDKLNPVEISNVLHGWAVSLRKDQT
jgi:hypothetical protein